MLQNVFKHMYTTCAEYLRYVCVCMYACMYVYACMHVCVCMHACVCVCVYFCVCMHAESLKPKIVG